ncbi:MAG TPA: BRO family protein [Candidatus Limiplasma sp.]|nr:BRO family protein [Candidatus Limiplasma sp.]
MENTAIRVYSSQAFGEVRTVMRDGEPWFVAADVCRVLGHSNPTMAVGGLEEDEKMTLSLGEGHSGKRGGAQTINVINEGGLYTLVFRSNKENAVAFRRWVTHEVLPSIRKTGAYARPDLSRDPDVVDALITALRHEQDLSAALQRRINWLTSPAGAEMRRQNRLRPTVEALPQKATTQFLTAVAALAQEEGRIESLHGEPEGYERLIGYEDEERFYLIPARAYPAAVEWCAQRGEPMLLTQRALQACLRERGAILPAADGRSNTRVTRICGRAMRLLWVYKLAMLAEGERRARLGEGRDI